jgi:bacterioferritin
MQTQRFDTNGDLTVTRDDLVSLLNDDLAREYHAIISYVVYSQVLNGAKDVNIAAELEKHVAEEITHDLLIAGQIYYLGGIRLTAPKSVKTSAKAEEMLRFDGSRTIRSPWQLPWGWKFPM